MSKKLNIITADSDSLNSLTIRANGDNYNLAYETENNGQVSITNESSRVRPIRLSELSRKLEQRDWNITERKYVSDSGNDNVTLKVKVTSSSGAIDTINSTSDKSSTGNIIGVTVSNPAGIEENLKNQFENDYNSILGSMTENEIYIYNSSRNTIDLINNSIIINAIKYDSDSYTNMLNLDDLVNRSAQTGISGKVDLTVQYSKGSKIINHDTTFEAFKFSNNSLESTDFVEEIGSDVVIEYSNNTIRVIPTADDINECIIRNCTITYGNIN